jgi:Zn-dependent protease
VIPLPAYLVALQLGVAVLLAALWRSRRLGPLVPEPLPVVVRASETAEGHAGLYRSRRARGRAAAALRTALLNRTLPALGLPPDAGAADVVAAFSARSGSGQDRIEAMLFGPAPRDDTALVALADELDALEKEVRTQ